MREELTRAVTDLGFETPTPIQQKVIPLLLENPVDIIGLAQTGTGKTAAFGLPLLQHSDPDQKHVQCLVLSPTRELCMQIQEELKKYGAHMRGLKIAAVYGGVPISGQLREVKANPQIVVATPGRLIDLLERGALNMDQVKYVVLDEADEMLNMGFREDIDFILKSTPQRQHTWLFSATMSNEVRGIAKRFMKSWEEISVAPANQANQNIDHQYYVTNNHNRFDTLQRLLDFTPGIYGIIFVRTRQDCQDIAEKLMKQGYHVSPLHGDMDQKMRSKVMDRFKSKQLQAIIATDVAARGLDVNDITHVINYELPDDQEVYTHRSGRTARAGKSGICMSIVTPKEIGIIRQIERIAKAKFHKSDIPDGAEVVRKKLFHYLDQIAEAEPKEDFAKLYQHNIHERFEEMDKDELIRRLIWLQLKDSIETYGTAKDLNAGFDKGTRERGGDRGERGDRGDRGERSTDRSGKAVMRLFINLGQKEGMTNDKLVEFIVGSTDIEPGTISGVTVRELSSYFNVGSDAAEFIMTALASKKFKGRKVRVDEAEQRTGGGRPSFGGGDRSGGGGFRGRDSDRGGYRGKRDDSGSGGGGGRSSFNRDRDSSSHFGRRSKK